MPSRDLKMALVLGLLSAIGPFAIDMYLPAMPDIGHSLGAEVGAVQLTLTAFFLSIGLGQLLYGPVSDMVGRKPPLYAGLALFTLASIGCALATDIQTLVALRFLQGLGAAAMGIVGLFANGRPLPMVVGMASGALIALALTWITLRGPVHATPVERLKG